MKHRTLRVTGILALIAFVMTAWTPLVTAQASSKPAGVHININTASAAELAKLPRIGEKIAQRIIDYRSKNGPFKNPEDLMKVTGIGEKIFAQIRAQIEVGQAAAAAKQG